jgi:hypothetical protein
MNGWNGMLKQTTLCLGAGCFMEEGFEIANCAIPYATADPEDALALGPAEPGCEGWEECDDGLSPPCDTEGPEPEYEGSA